VSLDRASSMDTGHRGRRMDREAEDYVKTHVHNGINERRDNLQEAVLLPSRGNTW
jgi:hypothetical protein